MLFFKCLASFLRHLSLITFHVSHVSLKGNSDYISNYGRMLFFRKVTYSSFITWKDNQWTIIFQVKPWFIKTRPRWKACAALGGKTCCDITELMPQWMCAQWNIRGCDHFLLSGQALYNEGRSQETFLQDDNFSFWYLSQFCWSTGFNSWLFKVIVVVSNLSEKSESFFHSW